MKEKIKGILIVIISMLIASGTTVTALLVTNANNITLSSSKTDKTNVAGALDEIYTNINNLVQCNKDENGNYKCPKCIRATTLHTELCENSVSTMGGTLYACSGAVGEGTGNVITYGNKIITKGELHTGEPFICDVNGDGLFNEQTERFYYVSDYYDTINSSLGNDIFDEETAVLIYYSNTYRNGTTAVQTDANKGKSYNTSNYNYQGPKGLITYLPKTSEWTNISLKETTRQMRSEKGEKTVNNGSKTLPTYSYDGYAARLLTTQELIHGCNIDVSLLGGSETDNLFVLKNCKFLVQNTAYANYGSASASYWLETPISTASNSVWGIYGLLIKVNSLSANATGPAVRPVIEVAKSDMFY